MNWIDAVIVLLVIAGAYFGYKKGLLVEIITFFAFIIATISAFHLMNSVVNYFINDGERNNRIYPFLAFLIIFLLVFIGIFLLGKLIKNLIDLTLLGSFDAWAGALIGALKIAFGVSLIFWLMHHSNVDIPSKLISDSYIYPVLLPFASKVIHGIGYVIPFQDIFSLVKETLKGK